MWKDKVDFEEAYFYDKIGIIPYENETLERFIRRAFLTFNHSEYEELKDRQLYRQLPPEFLSGACEEVKNLLDMNLFWVDCRYNRYDDKLKRGDCKYKPLIKKGIEIIVPLISIDRGYIKDKIECTGKATLRHELIHAGRSFNFYEMPREDTKADEYLVEWLGNFYGNEGFNIDLFRALYNCSESLSKNLEEHVKLVDLMRKKLKEGFGRKESLYIISRLLEKEMKLIANSDEIEFVKTYPGLKWDIIRHKLYK